MARKSRQTNGIETDVAADFIRRIEHCFAGIDSAKGVYMREAKSFREDVKEIYSEAKGQGVPTKALRAMVKQRDLEKKIRNLSDGLDIDEAAGFEQMKEALGSLVDLPLGQAALDAHPGRAAKAATDAELIKNLNPFPPMPETDAARAGDPFPESNAA